MRRILVVLARTAGIGLAVALAGGYLGVLHPLGDSLAVFRLWFGAALAGVGVLSLFLGDRLCAGGAVLVAALAATPIGWARVSATAAPLDADVVVYVKNLANAWADTDAIADDIYASDADLILLQEINTENASILPAQLPEHPYWHLCQFSGWSGMAVVSRWPLSDTACSEVRSLAVARVATPSGPVFAASIHQFWPYPYEQADLLPMVLGMVAVPDERRIIAGDFNMVPWGHSVRRIAEASGTSRIGPVQTTIRVRDVPLPIDHVLTNGVGSVERRPQLGSDHYGLVARISFDAPR